MVPWNDGRVCHLLYDVYQMMSLWSLYGCGPRSSRPQPMGVAETKETVLQSLPAVTNSCSWRW